MSFISLLVCLHYTILSSHFKLAVEIFWIALLNVFENIAEIYFEWPKKLRTELTKIFVKYNSKVGNTALFYCVKHVENGSVNIGPRMFIFVGRFKVVTILSLYSLSKHLDW